LETPRRKRRKGRRANEKEKEEEMQDSSTNHKEKDFDACCTPVAILNRISILLFE
jgi:hypothetical protein